MAQSSRRPRAAKSRRWKRILATAWCAATLLHGSYVLSDEGRFGPPATSASGESQFAPVVTGSRDRNVAPVSSPRRPRMPVPLGARKPQNSSGKRTPRSDQLPPGTAHPTAERGLAPVVNGDGRKPQASGKPGVAPILSAADMRRAKPLAGRPAAASAPDLGPISPWMEELPGDASSSAELITKTARVGNEAAVKTAALTTPNKEASPRFPVQPPENLPPIIAGKSAAGGLRLSGSPFKPVSLEMADSPPPAETDASANPESTGAADVELAPVRSAAEIKRPSGASAAPELFEENSGESAKLAPIVPPQATAAAEIDSAAKARLIQEAKAAKAEAAETAQALQAAKQAAAEAAKNAQEAKETAAARNEWKLQEAAQALAAAAAEREAQKAQFEVAQAAKQAEPEPEPAVEEIKKPKTPAVVEEKPAPEAPAEMENGGEPPQKSVVQPKPARPFTVKGDNQQEVATPFDVIEEAGTVHVKVRRSKLLRTKKDIYRTAVVDEAVVEVVQFTPREISLIGKGQGTTHVTFWFDDPNTQPVTYLVQCDPDAAEVKRLEDNYRMLEDMINEMYPDSKIHLQIMANKLLVKGQAKDSEEAFQIMTIIRGQGGGQTGANGVGGLGGGFGFGGLNEGVAADPLSDSATGNARRSQLQIVNMLRIPGIQQVALRVKIAELNRTAARNFGVSVQGKINLNSGETASKVLLNSVLATSNGVASPIIGQYNGSNNQSLSVGLNYLQERGVIRLLSEPTLVTMSGRPATFVAGGEFAVPTIVGSAGLNAVTTDFRAFGAIISFLPTVVDKDRIRLQVSPEFSQINQQLTVGNTPGLKVRSATTTVEMREGQTLAIAGLLEDTMTNTIAGDLPFLSKIFGRRNTTRSETELLILVTPDLIHPMDPEEVPPLPGFDVTEPNNSQFFLGGQIEGTATMDYRSTVWPRLRKRYGAGGPAMTSGPFGHGQ